MFYTAKFTLFAFQLSNFPEGASEGPGGRKNENLISALNNGATILQVAANT